VALRIVNHNPIAGWTGIAASAAIRMGGEVRFGRLHHLSTAVL
jgi:hypothetical protein